MKQIQSWAVAAGMLWALSGCDGGESRFTFEGNYGGTWDVRYNLAEDSCQVVEPGLLGFVDEHTITQTGTEIRLESSGGFEQPFLGTVTGDKLVASQQLDGDLYGDGIFCVLDQTISYEPLDDNAASTLFLREISCEDGFTCQTRAVGQSTRRS